MNRRSPLAILLLPALAAALLVAQPSTTAFAQSGYEPTVEQLKQVRDSLMRYEDVENAVADGFEQFGSCMSSTQGSQGIHFRHPERIADPTVDIMEPELLMYEPREDGSLRFIGVELLVFQADWHEAGNEAVPVQLGREFGINMTLLDRPFYALRAWVWQHNPSGFFANWNPLVSCEHEAGVGAGH